MIRSLPPVGSLAWDYAPTEDDQCSDCFHLIDDPEYHCPNCGDHVDGLGECQSGCAS